MFLLGDDNQKVKAFAQLNAEKHFESWIMSPKQEVMVRNFTRSWTLNTI